MILIFICIIVINDNTNIDLYQYYLFFLFDSHGGLCFTLAWFSEAFLILRAQQGGIPLALVLLGMVAMDLVYAGAAYPFGQLSDRMNHKTLLAWGLVVLIAADLVLASTITGQRFSRAWRYGVCIWESCKDCWRRWSPTLLQLIYAVLHSAFLTWLAVSRC